jgi:hypothetical protein
MLPGRPSVTVSFLTRPGAPSRRTPIRLDNTKHDLRKCN